jgi:hypothetical protein
MKEVILRWQEAALCLVSKWWRPVTCIGIAGGALVNLVIIPLVNWEVPDMASSAAYVAAATAAFGVRAWEKKVGIARGHG